MFWLLTSKQLQRLTKDYLRSNEAQAPDWIYMAFVTILWVTELHNHHLQAIPYLPRASMILNPFSTKASPTLPVPAPRSRISTAPKSARPWHCSKSLVAILVGPVDLSASRWSSY